MKKFLIPILTVIILLTGCNHTNTGQEPSTSYSDPPPTIIIRNKETLENIQDILTGDDMTEDEFGEYVAYTLYAVIGNGITKQDFICLFELFEAMSVPVSEDLKLSGIYYIPPDNDLSVFFKSNSEEMYTFTFHIDRPTVCLLYTSGKLGGMSTSGLVGPFMSCYDSEGTEQIVLGIFDEVCRRAVSKGGAIHPSQTKAGSTHTSYYEYGPVSYTHLNWQAKFRFC